MIMKEKLQTLPLTTLREIAKDKNIKGTSTMKKAELIEALLALPENESGMTGMTEAISIQLRPVQAMIL